MREVVRVLNKHSEILEHTPRSSKGLHREKTEDIHRQETPQKSASVYCLCNNPEKAPIKNFTREKTITTPCKGPEANPTLTLTPNAWLTLTQEHVLEITYVFLLKRENKSTNDPKNISRIP